MNGLAGVAQRCLGVPFWVTMLKRPLGPGVAVAVQADAFNLEDSASPAKFRSPVVGGGLAPVREERPLLGELAEQGSEPRPDGYPGRFGVWLEFGAMEPQNPVAPVDVDGCPGSSCRIGVAGGEVNPAQVPVKHWPLSRLVLGVEQLLGIRPASDVEAFLSAAEIILDVKDA